MRSLWLLASGLALTFAGAHLGRNPDLEMVSGYRSWRKVTPKPLHLAPSLSALCIGAPAWNLGSNPHDPKFFTVYVNPTGEKAMLARKSAPFPQGTVIVKEKLGAANAKSPELLTVMRKSGDGWRFFSVDGQMREAYASNGDKCRSCHAMAASQDYVFRSYIHSAPHLPNPGTPRHH